MRWTRCSGRFGFAPSEILWLRDRYPGARGSLRLPEVVSLAEPAAQSAMESRLRMVLVLAGLARPIVQHQVRDAGRRLLARVGLACPEELVAIEYEGENHFTDEQGRRDVHRYTRLVNEGWGVYRYIARDVYHNPTRIVADISRALHRQRLRP